MNLLFLNQILISAKVFPEAVCERLRYCKLHGFLQYFAMRLMRLDILSILIWPMNRLNLPPLSPPSYPNISDVNKHHQSPQELRIRDEKEGMSMQLNSWLKS